MTTPAELTDLFSITTWVCQNQAKELSHEQSLLQLPFRGNCFNWVLGHIVVNRNSTLELVGADPVISPEELKRYQSGSDPITVDDSVIALDRLLAAIDTSQQKLADAFKGLNPEAFDKITNEKRQQSLRYQLLFRYFHESFHAGQLEILRQLAGVNDAII